MHYDFFKKKKKMHYWRLEIRARPALIKKKERAGLHDDASTILEA
jgi:hypothetical protein